MSNQMKLMLTWDDCAKDIKRLRPERYWVDAEFVQIEIPLCVQCGHELSVPHLHIGRTQPLCSEHCAIQYTKANIHD